MKRIVTIVLTTTLLSQPLLADTSIAYRTNLTNQVKGYSSNLVVDFKSEALMARLASAFRNFRNRPPALEVTTIVHKYDPSPEFNNRPKLVVFDQDLGDAGVRATFGAFTALVFMEEEIKRIFRLGIDAIQFHHTDGAFFGASIDEAHRFVSIATPWTWVAFSELVPALQRIASELESHQPGLAVLPWDSSDVQDIGHRLEQMRKTLLQAPSADSVDFDRWMAAEIGALESAPLTPEVKEFLLFKYMGLSAMVYDPHKSPMDRSPLATQRFVFPRWPDFRQDPATFFNEFRTFVKEHPYLGNPNVILTSRLMTRWMKRNMISLFLAASLLSGGLFPTHAQSLAPLTQKQSKTLRNEDLPDDWKKDFDRRRENFYQELLEEIKDPYSDPRRAVEIFGESSPDLGLRALPELKALAQDRSQAGSVRYRAVVVLRWLAGTRPDRVKEYLDILIPLVEEQRSYLYFKAGLTQGRLSEYNAKQVEVAYIQDQNWKALKGREQRATFLIAVLLDAHHWGETVMPMRPTLFNRFLFVVLTPVVLKSIAGGLTLVGLVIGLLKIFKPRTMAMGKIVFDFITVPVTRPWLTAFSLGYIALPLFWTPASPYISLLRPTNPSFALVFIAGVAYGIKKAHWVMPTINTALHEFAHSLFGGEGSFFVAGRGIGKSTLTNTTPLRAALSMVFGPLGELSIAVFAFIFFRAPVDLLGVSFSSIVLYGPATFLATLLTFSAMDSLYAFGKVFIGPLLQRPNANMADEVPPDGAQFKFVWRILNVRNQVIVGLLITGYVGVLGMLVYSSLDPSPVIQLIIFGVAGLSTLFFPIAWIMAKSLVPSFDVSLGKRAA